MSTLSLINPMGPTCAVSNTGPLISAFQSNSFKLLTQIFAEIQVSKVCQAELIRHGWEAEVKAAFPKLVAVPLAGAEEPQALIIAQQIARHPHTKDPVAENHLGEAQAMVIALRAEHSQNLLLLDELAARAIAKQRQIKLSGFPGVLLLAVQLGLISAEELKVRLDHCRVQGTHYSVSFIQQVYEMASSGPRQR